MTFLVMFLTPFGFSEESEEIMGEGERLDRVDLEFEGERGGRVVLCCRMGRLSTLAIGFRRRHAQGTPQFVDSAKQSQCDGAYRGWSL